MQNGRIDLMCWHSKIPIRNRKEIEVSHLAEINFTGTCNYLYIGPINSYTHVRWIGLEVNNIHREKIGKF